MYNEEMSGRTVSVEFENDQWVVRRLPSKSGRRVFTTKSEAVAAAKALARGTQPSQVIVHDRAGRVSQEYGYGLPKIQPLPYRGTLRRDQIERAVSSIIGN